MKITQNQSKFASKHRNNCQNALHNFLQVHGSV